MAYMANLFACLCCFLAFVLSPTTVFSTPLKKGFYQKSCPQAEIIVRSTVKKALANDSGIPAALIRLHFHDCFVRGCDASILIDSTPTNKAEKDSSSNLGVGGFDVIDSAKAKLETICPNTVSCADIVAFAAREGIFLAGGLYYDVPAGRRDGTISLETDASKNLPGEFFNVLQLKNNFAAKGLSLKEMVTLSGAHSIGDSHCSSFSKRLYNFNATYSQDPSLDPSYANYLKTKCPKTSNFDPTVSFDPSTPNKLDNNYYKELEAHKGLLFSDQVLWDTPTTRPLVRNYGKNPNDWASKFTKAMIHMGYIEVIIGSQGQIRRNCKVVN